MTDVSFFFMKNPETGKAKSRLAAAISEDSAICVYKNLAKGILLTLKPGTPFHFMFASTRGTLRSLLRSGWGEDRYIAQKERTHPCSASPDPMIQHLLSNYTGVALFTLGVFQI